MPPHAREKDQIAPGAPERTRSRKRRAAVDLWRIRTAHKNDHAECPTYGGMWGRTHCRVAKSTLAKSGPPMTCRYTDITGALATQSNDPHGATAINPSCHLAQHPAHFDTIAKTMRPRDHHRGLLGGCGCRSSGSGGVSNRGVARGVARVVGEGAVVERRARAEERRHEEAVRRVGRRAGDLEKRIECCSADAQERYNGRSASVLSQTRQDGKLVSPSCSLVDSDMLRPLPRCG